MQLIEVIPSGPLASLYPKIKIAATTAAEAIEGWSRQVSTNQIPQIMEAVGFDTEITLHQPTKVKKLYLYPSMFGGGGSFGQIILGAALIGMAFVPGLNVIGLSAMALTSVGAAGIGMVLGGLMGVFMKTPSLSKSEDPEASKYIGTGRNTTAIGTPIGIGAGRIMIGGQFLSVQVNSTDLVYGSFPTTPT